MKFIHLADCHLASENKFQAQTSDFIRGQVWESFEQIFTDNKDKDFALIAGDLYERSFFTASDYKRLFKLIKEFKKNVYYVTGNHDYIGEDNRIFFTDKPKNLKIFSSDKVEFFEEKNVRIYGISYKDRIFKEDFPYGIRLDPNFFNILLVHGVVGEDRSNYLNLNLSKLENVGFDYVALGHIHKPLSLSSSIHYAGTTEAKDFSEKLDYGYIAYKDGNPQRIDISKLKFTDLKLKASDYKNEEDLIQAIGKRLDEKINFLRLTLINDKDFVLDEDTLKDDLNLFYLDLNLDKAYDLESLRDFYKDSLLDRFIENADKVKTDKKISRRAKELGMDAILRSKYE